MINLLHLMRLMNFINQLIINQTSRLQRVMPSPMGTWLISMRRSAARKVLSSSMKGR